MPGCAEKPAMPRIHPSHGLAARLRVRGVGRAIGVEAVADMGWADAVGRPADDRPGRVDDVTDRFEGLHHRPVVGGVDEARGCVSDEVEGPLWGAAAVQLGEVREHAAANADAAENLPRGSGELLVGRNPIRERRPRRIGPQVGRRRDEDGDGLQPGGADGALPTAPSSRRRLVLAGDDDLEDDLGAGRLGEPPHRRRSASPSRFMRMSMRQLRC